MKTAFVSIVILLFIFVAQIIVSKQFDIVKTKKQVEELAKKPMDDQPVGFLNQKDVYGQQLKFDRVANDLQITQIVTSAGPDKIFSTDDDITYQSIDLNKSKLLGRYVGQKSKEFVKGLKSVPPTRFEKHDKAVQSD